ncbi:hypothetical protein D3C85_1386790 [compost metagenome]
MQAIRNLRASAPVAEPYDSEKRCRAYYDSDLRPFAADGLTYSVWKSVWHAAQFDRAMHPDSSKQRPHSAPVAGEAQRLYSLGEVPNPMVEALRAGIEGECDGLDLSDQKARFILASMLNRDEIYAAPQASEAVRDEDRQQAAVNANAPLLKAARRAVLALAAAAERDPAFQGDYDALSAALSAQPGAQKKGASDA